MASEQKPNPVSLESLVKSDSSGLSALVDLEAADAPAGPLANLMAMQINTGIAGHKASEKVRELDAKSAAQLVRDALAAKLTPENPVKIAEWLRARYPEDKIVRATTFTPY